MPTLTSLHLASALKVVSERCGESRKTTDVISRHFSTRAFKGRKGEIKYLYTYAVT